MQPFGSETERLCGICSVLEVEPLAREVFAGHWTGKSSTRMHSHVLLASCEHFRARRCRCDSICDPLEFEPLIFDGWFNLKLAQVIEGFSDWFRGYSGLVQKLFEGYSIQGWCVGYFKDVWGLFKIGLKFKGGLGVIETWFGVYFKFV